MKIAFLLYPTAAVKTDEDSSFWVMHELRRRGHDVSHFEARHLIWRDGELLAELSRSRLDPRKGFIPLASGPVLTDLTKLDCIFIRKEPPFDNRYLHALQLLETIKSRVFILNDPAGIAMCNEKMFALRFPEFIPESVVTRDPATAVSFVRSLDRRVVVKPLDQKGGVGIFAVAPKDESLRSLLETATDLGKRAVLVQRYVEDNRKRGDKRILILDGRIIGSFLRRPSAGDFRANLGVGGTMHASKPDAREEKLVAAMVPELSRNGLYFAGIDVIGGYLSEVNVTSPSGIPEINALTRKKLQVDVADFIERRLSG